MNLAIGKKDGKVFEECLLGLMEDHFELFVQATPQQDWVEGWDCAVNNTHIDVTLNFWKKQDVHLVSQDVLSCCTFNVGVKKRKGKHILVFGLDFPVRDLDYILDTLWDKWEDEILPAFSFALSYANDFDSLY